MDPAARLAWAAVDPAADPAGPPGRRLELGVQMLDLRGGQIRLRFAVWGRRAGGQRGPGLGERGPVFAEPAPQPGDFPVTRVGGRLLGNRNVTPPGRILVV